MPHPNIPTFEHDMNAAQRDTNATNDFDPVEVQESIIAGALRIPEHDRDMWRAGQWRQAYRSLYEAFVALQHQANDDRADLNHERSLTH